MSTRAVLALICLALLIYAAWSGCLARSFEEGNRRPRELAPHAVVRWVDVR